MGGIIPPIASDLHAQNISNVLEEEQWIISHILSLQFYYHIMTAATIGDEEIVVLHYCLFLVLDHDLKKNASFSISSMTILISSSRKVNSM